jgi:hypothetical protein
MRIRFAALTSGIGTHSRAWSVALLLCSALVWYGCSEKAWSDPTVSAPDAAGPAPVPDAAPQGSGCNGCGCVNCPPGTMCLYYPGVDGPYCVCPTYPHCDGSSSGSSGAPSGGGSDAAFAEAAAGDSSGNDAAFVEAAAGDSSGGVSADGSTDAAGE